MKFKVEVTETLQKVVEVEAVSLARAIYEVSTEYSKGHIRLDELDYKGFEVKEYKE